MAYVKRKRIKGNDYYYLAESYRTSGKDAPIQPEGALGSTSARQHHCQACS